jgi:imidazolonepropionase-like amidohydrolase
MKTVIQGARLIDGSGRPPLDDAVVILDGKRIAAVGKRGQVETPTADVRTIDAGGRTLLPGLMDLHALMTYNSFEELERGLGEKEMAMSVLRGAVNGRRFLEAGVTTVRIDLCGHHGVFALKDAFAQGIVPGPRLVVPGRAICMTGGHGWMWGLHEVDGPHEARKAARAELKAGADWVKLMASGGAGTATERLEDAQMTVEEMKAAVEEAHKKGKYAYAHVTCSEAAQNCLDAGVDSIEHGIDLSDEVLKGMKAAGAFLVPTLGLYRRTVEIGEKGGIPAYMCEKAKQAVLSHSDTFKRALKIGVKIAAGTDSGQDWNVNGESLLYELELMHREGMAPMDAIIAATRRAAECLRRDQELGTLESGKLADLLMVEGDPSVNIMDIRNTWMVLKEGEIVYRKDASPSPQI